MCTDLSLSLSRLDAPTSVHYVCEQENVYLCTHSIQSLYSSRLQPWISARYEYTQEKAAILAEIDDEHKHPLPRGRRGELEVRPPTGTSSPDRDQK
jgi:hypothetical protein